MANKKSKIASIQKKVQNKFANNTFYFHISPTINQFCELTNTPKNKIMEHYFEQSHSYSPFQTLSYDDVEELCTVFNFDLERDETLSHGTIIEKTAVFDIEDDKDERPPIVTIMGHVDHGKTTLLDYLRKSTITNQESGGITQHIGAYTVEYQDKSITVIDTPGHKAFTTMRARGANLTDIILLVVAADDGVKPQTIEAIEHAKNAKVPIIVVINKIDKPDVNFEKIQTDLASAGITPEEWGGDTIFVKISAITGAGINDLMEAILLTTEILALKANRNKSAVGTVIESRNEKGKGNTATVIVQNGTLKKGDSMVISNSYCKVKHILNQKFQSIDKALPSTPVRISGLSEQALAGDKFVCFKNDKEARKIANSRSQHQKILKGREGMPIQTSQIEKFLEEKKTKDLNFIIKADTEGTGAALKNMIEKIKNDEITIKVISSNTSPISDSDVLLAAVSNSNIIAFNNYPSSKVLRTASENKVQIKRYQVIYDIEDDIRQAMKGLTTPIHEEILVGEAEVREVFKSTKIGLIAGCMVVSGSAYNNKIAKVIREGKLIFSGTVASLKRFKNDAKEVRQGMECGITIGDFKDVKKADLIQFFENKVLEDDNKKRTTK